MVELSKRLQALANMVTPGSPVADVGCDHGFVSIYLVQKGISPRVYAMDVKKGPLLRAGEHVKEYGLEAYIETRMSDGVSALYPGEAKILFCAGMGGRLMQKILTQGKELIHSMNELVLQPQSEVGLFRKFLRQEGYRIVQEDMVYEEGKFYPMMRVIVTGIDHQVVEEQNLEDKFGPLLLKEKHPVLMQYLEETICTYEDILFRVIENNKNASVRGQEARERRIQELDREIEDMKLALFQIKG